ncbi:MAG: sigma-54 dependent transcriptional regulator [Bdellovibrionota bacterium]
MNDQAGNIKHPILIIDDDPGIVAALSLELEKEYTIHKSTSLKQAFEILNRHRIEVVLVDLHFRDSSTTGLDFIDQAKAIVPKTEFIVLTANRDSEMIISALERGASDYITKPFEINDLEIAVEKALHRALFGRGEFIRKKIAKYPEFVGRSKSSQMIREKIEKCAPKDANVLIIGESGTGKEVLSKHIHRLRNDPQRPFVALNCAAIPSELIESLLFGHEKGSFTGALGRKIGKFELANGGDVFLDEIGSMPMRMQAKLLRVLQEKEIERVGGAAPVKSNFRVIAASNIDLRKQIAQGTFREDLYYRLSVVQIHIPALRERREDIPLLISYYLENSPLNDENKIIDPKARAELTQYDWPGNIRQLFNVLDSMTILSQGPTLKVKDIPRHLLDPLVEEEVSEESEDFLHALDHYEMNWIKKTLQNTHGNKEKASQVLGITRSSLIRRMKRLKMME